MHTPEPPTGWTAVVIMMAAVLFSCFHQWDTLGFVDSISEELLLIFHPQDDEIQRPDFGHGVLDGVHSLGEVCRPGRSHIDPLLFHQPLQLFPYRVRNKRNAQVCLDSSALAVEYRSYSQIRL